MLDRPCWVKCMRSVETKNGDNLVSFSFDLGLSGQAFQS